MARGREGPGEGMRFVMRGSQMNLHALARGRWTLLDLDFDFLRPSLQARQE